MNENLRISYRDYSVPLSAGVPYEIGVAGTYWQLISASAGALVSMQFDESQGIGRLPGSGGPAQYSRVRLTSAVDQTVVVSLGFTGGLTPYDRGSLSFAGTLNVLSNNPVATPTLDDLVIASGATVLIDAALVGRLSLIVQLVAYGGPDLSTFIGFRVGDSSVSATRGALVMEGVGWPGTAGVYLHNPSPFSVTVTRQREMIP